MALDFSFTEEQEFFKQTIRDTVDRLIIPRSQELDENEEWPEDVWKEFASLGWLGLRHDEKYGGMNQPVINQMIFYEELFRGSLGFAMAVTMQVLMGTYFIRRFASDEIKQRILVPAIKGEIKCVICFTEDQSGSDLAGTRTLATKVDGGWRINGTKQWVTLGPLADVTTIMATTDPSKGVKGLNFFLVERKTEDRDGFVPGQILHKVGGRCAITGEIVLDNVFVPEKCFLGEELDKGIQYAGEVLNEVRVMTGIGAVAIAKCALDDAGEYANNRVAFGHPIGSYQLIREKFARCWAWYEAARTQLYKCAWMIENQGTCRVTFRDLVNLCMAAKFHATEMCITTVEETMRIYGGNAFCTEYPAQRYWKNAMFALYGGGTHEVLRDYLGRMYLKK
jgi:alkylation response protein AidB-like acyl-CoA dehydrogenase